MRNVSGKVVQKIKTHFMFYNFFPESCRLWENVERYGRSGQWAVHLYARLCCQAEVALQYVDLETVARGLAGGTALARREECSGEFYLLFPLVVGDTLTSTFKRAAWVCLRGRPAVCLVFGSCCIAMCWVTSGAVCLKVKKTVWPWWLYFKFCFGDLFRRHSRRSLNGRSLTVILVRMFFFTL